METSLLITLQNYGFSEKEAKVYLTVLELGTSIASTIARRSEIKRVTVYTILDDLKRKGIANETTKDEVKYYSVISPDILLKQLEQKYESFKKKVPELLALAEKFGNKPKVRFFEGKEWIKKMYYDTLDYPNTTIKAFMWIEESVEVIDILKKEYVPLRIKNNIKAEVITISDSYKKFANKNLVKVKLVKDNILNLFGEINIYWDDKIFIAMYTNNEDTWIIITSKYLHDTLSSIFDFIWEKI